MTPAETALAVIAGAAVIALVFRLSQRREEPESDADAVDRLLAEVSGVSPRDAAEVAAVTTDGVAFVPESGSVKLLPTASADPMIQKSSLDPGDLIAARVRRGTVGFDPWRLEALGRDEEYHAWFFETEEAVRAALALLERHVVRPPRDEAGEPRSFTGEDFERARRIDEETERQLDEEDWEKEER